MAYATENLDKTLFKVIQDYCGDIESDMRKVIKGVSLEAKKRLRETSPQSGRSQKKGYAKGWRIRTKDTGSSVEATVYNANKPGLAHLLEDGRKEGEKNGYRYPAAPAKPHIRKVEEWAVNPDDGPDPSTSTETITVTAAARNDTLVRARCKPGDTAAVGGTETNIYDTWFTNVYVPALPS